MATLGDQLISSAKLGIIESVGALLDQGVAVDSRGDHQFTPLMYASLRGHRAVAALLLDREADVNAESDWGGNAAILTCENGHLDTLQLLVSRGADIHHRDHQGWSSLLYAALYDRLPVCEYLLSLGANLMAASNNIITALADYGRSADPRPFPETKALRVAALQKAWENGPHPSQVQRRRDDRWVRRGPLLVVLAEHAYRPLQARALEISLAAESLDPDVPVVVQTSRMQDVLRQEGLVRHIVAFL